MMDERRGLFAALKGFADSALALVHTRLELFVVEAAEERQRLSSLLALSLAAALLLVLGALLAVAALTLALWEHRVLVVGLAAAAFLLAGIGCALQARARARTRSHLFAASLGELQRDRDALRATSVPE